MSGKEAAQRWLAASYVAQSPARSREALMLVIICALIGLVAARFPGFASPSSLANVFNDTAPLIILAVGQTLVILTRCIDLSVAANLALTGMICAMLDVALPGLPGPLILCLAAALGTLAGLANGLLVWKLGIPPIVTTLGTMAIFRGAIFLISEGKWINAHEMSAQFTGFPRIEFSGLPLLSWLAVVICAFFVLFVARAPLGRAFYAVGGNPQAAIYAGLDVGRTQCAAFTISGALAGLTGYLWVARYSVAYVDIASGFELEVVAACAIGGISIAGGAGTVAGAILGALFLGLVKNALPVIGISPFWQLTISGSAIVIAVAFNARARRPAGRNILKRRAGQARCARPPDEARTGKWVRTADERERQMNKTGETGEAARKGASRRIPFRLHSPLRRAMASWEILLLTVAIALFIANSLASPWFLNAWTLSDATFNFTEKAMIALAMALLVIAGEIDLSVAAIVALASTAMGAAAQLGLSTPVLVLTGLFTGLACGAFNGVLVTRLAMPSIIATIGTMSLFRGIAYIILGDQAWRGYPSDFAWFGQGYVWWVISFELALFAFLALAFFVLLHRTNFGRAVFAIGNNPVGALFAGIAAGRVKFLLFLLTGAMSGIAAVCLTSRLGSTRPSIAFGWELEIVTLVVLGGVNILGGRGSIPGVVIAAFVMGLVTFGLGLLNVPGIVMSIFVGLLLIGVIALPRLWTSRSE